MTFGKHLTIEDRELVALRFLCKEPNSLLKAIVELNIECPSLIVKGAIP